MKSVDVAIIGAGTAGLNARRGAFGVGSTVAIFDPGPLGTTCARIGCMPSKLLIAAAEAAHQEIHGEQFGVHAKVTIDKKAVMARVRTFRDLFVSKTKVGIHKLGTPIAKNAKFVGPSTLDVEGERYEAKAIVIATGSQSFIPGPYRDLGDALLTNASIFELEELPDSMLVIGAGAIGLELGQAMHRLGVTVKVLDLSGTLAGLQKPSLAQRYRDALGLELHLHHTLHHVEKTDAGVRVRFTGEDGKEHDDTWQYVLVAAGRVPNLNGLNLAAAGLDPLPPINPLTGQIGDSAVYIAGDATGDRMLLHEATYEGSVVGANAGRHPHPQPSPRKTSLGIVFTDPQVATVGVASDLTASLDLNFQARAKVLGRTDGVFEIYANSDGKLTGATLISADAEHLGHLLAWAVQSGMSVDQALEMPFYHPVLEEGIRGVLRDLRDQLKAHQIKLSPADAVSARA